MRKVEERGRGRWVAVAATVVIGLLAACGGASPSSTGPASSTPIKIGSPLPMTGTLSYYGQEYKRGFDLALKKINAAGGVDGHPLQIEYQDAPDAASQSEAMKKFNSEGIHIMIGTGSSTFDVADSAVGERLHMVTWAQGLSDQLTDRGLKYVVGAGTNPAGFVQPSLSVLTDMVPKVLNKPLSDTTIAIVASNDSYGQSNTGIQLKAIQPTGAKVVLQQSYDKTATDLSPVVLKIKSANPDVVLQTGYTDDIVLMWRQAKELGYLPKILISSGGAATTNFVQALGAKGVEGIVAYSFALPSAKIPASVQFAKDYQAAYGQPLPSGHALMTYSGMLRLADVMRQAKGDDPDAVMKAAHSFSKPVGYYPDGCGYKLSESGQNLNCAAVGLQWQGGSLKTIWPASSADAKFIGPLVPWAQK